MPVAKQRNRIITLKPVDWLAKISLKISIFNRYIKSHAEQKDITTRSTNELKTNDGYRTVLVRDGTAQNDFCGTLYVMDGTEVL